MPSTVSSSGRPKRTEIRLPSVDLLVEAGSDDVVAADVDALGVEDVADGVADGGHVWDWPSRDRVTDLLQCGVPEGGAGHGQHDHGREGDHQGAALDQRGQVG